MALGMGEDNDNTIGRDINLVTDISRLQVSQFSGRTRAYLRVQDGCNSFCSYCIVPYARGRSRSLPQAEVLSQAQAYARAGHLELVVTGIHVGHYGKDLGEGNDLADLLEKLCRALPEIRFRLSSIEPLELNVKLLTLIKELDNFIPHLHIPLQSGDNEILERMNRRYHREQFIACIDECRQFIPDAAIGIDVMVGFPGESQDHFNNTEALLEQIDCTYLHVFPYSIRPGTPAAEFSDQVDRHEKGARVEKLRALDDSKRERFYKRFLGSRRSVLIETERDKDGLLRGFTDNYIPVRVEGPDAMMNKIALVELIEQVNRTVRGHIVIG
jgi:threonylcarbamoyladenosine tRNA methylthiotransferase MtaB